MKKNNVKLITGKLITGKLITGGRMLAKSKGLILLIGAMILPTSNVLAGSCSFFHDVNGVRFAVKFAKSKEECMNMPVPNHDHVGDWRPRGIDNPVTSLNSQSAHTHDESSHSHSHSHNHSHDHQHASHESKQLRIIKPSPITILSTHTVVYEDDDD